MTDKNRETTKKSLKNASTTILGGMAYGVAYGTYEILTLPVRAIGAGVDAILDTAIESKKKKAAEADAKLPREKKSFTSFNINNVKPDTFREQLAKAGYTIEVTQKSTKNNSYLEYLNIYDKNHKNVGAFNVKSKNINGVRTEYAMGITMVEKDCQGLQDAVLAAGGKKSETFEYNCVKTETLAQNMIRKRNEDYKPNPRNKNR